jgi:Tfp pilus assembly protein PilF
MDLPFIIQYFANNTIQSGDVDVRLGWIRPVRFPKPFAKQPTVYITMFDESVEAVAGQVNTQGFRIFTGRSLVATKAEYQVSWNAFGTIEDKSIPIWRKMISIAKNDQLRADFRLELVNLESAFEIFVSQYLRPLLEKNGIIGDRLDWVLRRGIERKMSKWFKEATGQEAREWYGSLHERWKTDAKDLRNAVVHHGETVDQEKAKKARSVIIDYILSIDARSVEYFMIKVSKNIMQKKPVEVFGVGNVTAGTNSVTINFSLGALDKDLEKINPHIAKYKEFLKNGTYEGALTFCNKALEVVPNHIDALNIKILSLNTLQLHEDAISVCDHALKIEPDSTFVLYQKNYALIHLGRYLEALSCCDQVLERDPYHMAALCDRGFNLQRLNRPKDAIAEYDKVLQIYPHDVPTMINKGAALDELGDVQEAIKFWDLVLKIDPLNPHALKNKVNTLKKIGGEF